MKNILSSLLLLALTYTVQAQNQNVYRVAFEADSIPVSATQEFDVVPNLISLWSHAARVELTLLQAGTSTVIFQRLEQVVPGGTWNVVKSDTLTTSALGVPVSFFPYSASSIDYVHGTRMKYSVRVSGRAVAARVETVLKKLN